jgi:hypothetical protein
MNTRLGSRIGGIGLIAALAIGTGVAGATLAFKSAQAGTAPCNVAFGMYETNAPWDSNMTYIRSLDTQINRHSSIVHWYGQWGDPGSGIFSYNQPRMITVTENYNSVGVTGAEPLITWEAWGPAPYSVANNTFPLKSIAAGNFDAYIDTWANGMKVYGPVMLDIFHEMDGNWYPWGYQVNGNTPADYIAAYRHVHDRFTRAGATNVKFVWNPTFWNPSGVDQRNFYPGDGYVDVMAIDVYNWGARGGASWESMAQALSDQQIYNKLISLNATKPIILAEWATNEPAAGDPPGVTKGQWVIDAAAALSSQFPRITGAVWFSDTGSSLAIDSSASSIAGAKTAFGGCSSPPPPPSPSPRPSPSPSPSPSPIQSPSPTPGSSPSATPSPAPKPSPSAAPKPSPSPHSSPSPGPRVSPPPLHHPDPVPIKPPGPSQGPHRNPSPGSPGAGAHSTPSSDPVPAAANDPPPGSGSGGSWTKALLIGIGVLSGLWLALELIRRRRQLR